MPVIERDGLAPIVLDAPSDRALASLWELAQLEYAARDGQEPVSQVDWAAVTERYHALITERRADLGGIIREVREASIAARRELPSARPVAPWVRDEYGVVRNDQGHVVRMPMPEPPAPLLRLDPVELQPGLVVRELQPDEVAGCREAMQAAKVYEHDPEAAARWVASNRSLATVVAWHGRALAYEFYHVLGRDVLAGLLVHVTPERSYWFWRECQRPLWQLFLRLGYTKMRSYTRADRPDFVQALKDRWVVREFGRQPEFVILDYDIAASLERCVGWPARRTVGPAWSWRYEDVTIREMRDEDLPRVAQTIPELFRGIVSRGDIALSMLEPWWHLDRASVLLGYEGDTLRHIRAVRPRKPEAGIAATAALSPLWRTRQHRVFMYGVATWLQAVGYSELTAFTPESAFNTPATQFHFGRGDWTIKAQHTQYREPFYELSLSVPQYLSQPITARLALA